MKRHFSKFMLAAAIAALALAAPTPGFSQAKKGMATKCTEGERCVASCNALKWCTVNVCTGGKMQATMFGCAEMFCRNKKC
jgi:hypothetical protein